MSESAKYGEVSVQGLNLMKEFCFKQRQPWGRRGQTRVVSVAVPRDLLRSLTPYLACEPAHAVWHAENPTRAFPCPGDNLNPACNEREPDIALQRPSERPSGRAR